MIKIMVLIGVRPQVIKAAPLIKEMYFNDAEIELILVHSGQHYDFELSKIFFNELDLPSPFKNLSVKGGTHSEQTAKIMLELEKVIRQVNPATLVVFGDANTTLGGALAAVKNKIPVAHVEAGLRSWDMRMPEEINRVVTDHISQVLYAPTEFAFKFLLKEGILAEQIELSGDTMYDAVLGHKGHIEKSEILDELDLERENYALVTAHRAENVDDSTNLKNIIDALIDISQSIPVVFPIHPRTLKRLHEFRLHHKFEKTRDIKLIKPVGYFEMLKLIKEAAVMLTDSGGIQKEAFILGTPCITMRIRTEWIETIELGGNILVGPYKERIVKETLRTLSDFKKLKKKLKNIKSPYGDGKASKKILTNLKERISEKKLQVGLLPTTINFFLS